ncbi:MAG: hydrogen gas-evolving membrane-bound hydrogenase subunit E, partial [Bacteroidales bacterium]
SSMIIIGFLMYIFANMIGPLQGFGEHTLRMAEYYTQKGAESTGSANLVTGVLFDFRGYDTLGEATILFTAAVGVVTILRTKSKKDSAS